MQVLELHRSHPLCWGSRGSSNVMIQLFLTSWALGQDQLQEILGQSMNAEMEDEALEEFKVLELEVLPAAPTKVFQEAA